MRHVRRCFNEERRLQYESAEKEFQAARAERAKFETEDLNKVFSLVTNQKGDQQFARRVSGSRGGNSCWSRDHEFNVIRGDAEIILEHDRTGLNETRFEGLIIPLAPCSVVEERWHYNDCNGRDEIGLIYHYFTVSNGWRLVQVL